MTQPADTALAPYDAILLVSFGGPEKPEEVIDFLEVVTGGAGIPRSRLAEVGEHYFLFGGRSPINDQCKALIEALRVELDERGEALPIYWGNRNWHPFIDAALREVAADGHRRVLMVTTSAYPSFSGCRSYREDVARALTTTGLDVQIDRVGNYALDEGFVTANAQALRTALAELPGAQVLFVTHSIPEDMNRASGPEAQDGTYVTWHEQVAERVMAAAGATGSHDLVYCSRSGRPEQPWLEPDINDRLKALHAQGVDRVVVAPIGFVSDHMEVIYDLDTEARATADRLGMQMVRVPTVGTSRPFVAALVDRMERRAAQARQAGDVPLGAPEGCGGEGCCRNLRNPERPALV